MKINKFQVVVIGIFVLCLIAGVAAFALYKGNSSSTSISPVTIWGTFPANIFDQYVAKINNNLSQTITIKYIEKNPASFSQEFISALARGTGPDGLLIPTDMILPHLDKLSMIPFDALPQRTFLDSYIEGSKIYLYADGVLALPFTVDPLVMYWNKDVFNAAGIASYPKYWDEFTNLNKKLTLKDENGNIRKSAIAMGDFTNVSNARELLGSLIMQLGNPITSMSKEGSIVSTLKPSFSASPVEAVDFFTQFSNPSNANYSWNKGMPSSKLAFLSGSLATYFGFASELSDIKAKNPNLNYDVAPLPQLRRMPADIGKAVPVVYAKMNSFSIVRSSAVPNAVYQIMSILTDPANLSMLNQNLYLPTVRRDMIAEGSSDPYISIFNMSALISKTWLDADSTKSRAIFANMIESVTSGAKTSYQAVQDASDEYDVVLMEAVQ